MKPLFKAFFFGIVMLKENLINTLCMHFQWKWSHLGKENFVSIPVVSQYFNRFFIPINFTPLMKIFHVLETKLSYI